MTQWEYLIVFIADSKIAQDNQEMDVHLDADTFTDRLNKYGAAGWELVSFSWEANGARAALKRPKPAPAAPAPEANSPAEVTPPAEATPPAE